MNTYSKSYISLQPCTISTFWCATTRPNRERGSGWFVAGRSPPADTRHLWADRLTSMASSSANILNNNTAEMAVGKRFKGKVAIVTASTQGIGYSIAERLGFEGASVIISSRKQINVDDAARKLESKGIDVLGIVCHVSNPHQRKNLVSVAVQKYGKIDIIVCNAAANPSIDPILQMQESALDKIWEVNVKAAILLLQDAAAHLSKGSSVVLISSIAAYNPLPPLTMYGVTKTALLGLTKVLAAEMAPHTRVNCVAPGIVPTHFAEAIVSDSEIRNAVVDKILLKRLGRGEDMAGAVAFLVSEDASFVNGETLVVSGGLFVNGKFCIDPSKAKADHFFSYGLNKAGNTSSTPQGSVVTLVSAETLPGLNTLGISMGRIDIAQGGVISPHIHPRATEIVTVLEGTTYVGFVTSSPQNRLFAKLLKAGDVFVFPQGLVHFLQNVGKTNFVAISALSSQNPGTTLIPNAVFGSNNGRIPDAVLTKAFQVDQKVIYQLQKPFSSSA